MCLIKKEIMGQYAALKKTYEYVMSKSDQIRELLSSQQIRRIAYLGCGSSYCLCRSGEIASRLMLDIDSFSLPAGDMMLNYSRSGSMLRDALLVIPSRSGSTSEVIKLMDLVKDDPSILSLAISAKRNSSLTRYADLSLEIPWAFDKSVCQTRTVSNFYTTILMINAIQANDKAVLAEISFAINNGDQFIQEYWSKLEAYANDDRWENVVILADGILQGIAEEAALAFIEICQANASYYHVLDVRHGPIVKINQNTLVIIASQTNKISLQKNLILDLQQKGATVLVVGANSANELGADWHIEIPYFEEMGVIGIPFIFVSQALAYFRAIKCGFDPDKPAGLDPWIMIEQ